MDRNSHILQHFAKEICLKCGESLIRIGDQLFSLHSTLTCVQSANDLYFKDDDCVQSDFVNETINFHDFADVQNKLIDVFEVKINPNEMMINANISNIMVTQSLPVMASTTNNNNNNDNNNTNASAIVQSMATVAIVEPAPLDDGQHLNYTQALSEMAAIQEHKSSSSATTPNVVQAELKATVKNTTTTTTITTKPRKASTSAWNSQMVKCEIEGCDKEMSRNALSYHMLKHRGDQFICDLCGASLSSKSGIRSHLLTHVKKDERLKCEICELTYATKSGLRKHQKFVHSKDRSKMLICFQCGEELRQPYLLREHMNKHTGLKPFMCGYCTKSFRTKRLRSEHERIHTGEKPYKCSVEECDRSFLYLIDLKRHKYTVHRIYTKQFPCQVCAKVFSENMLLRKHMKSHNRIVDKKAKKSTRAKKTKT